MSRNNTIRESRSRMPRPMRQIVDPNSVIDNSIVIQQPQCDNVSSKEDLLLLVRRKNISEWKMQKNHTSTFLLNPPPRRFKPMYDGVYSAVHPLPVMRRGLKTELETQNNHTSTFVLKLPPMRLKPDEKIYNEPKVAFVEPQNDVPSCQDTAPLLTPPTRQRSPQKRKRNNSEGIFTRTINYVKRSVTPSKRRRESLNDIKEPLIQDKEYGVAENKNVFKKLFGTPRKEIQAHIETKQQHGTVNNVPSCQDTAPLLTPPTRQRSPQKRKRNNSEGIFTRTINYVKRSVTPSKRRRESSNDIKEPLIPDKEDGVAANKKVSKKLFATPKKGIQGRGNDNKAHSSVKIDDYYKTVKGLVSPTTNKNTTVKVTQHTIQRQNRIAQFVPMNKCATTKDIPQMIKNRNK